MNRKQRQPIRFADIRVDRMQIEESRELLRRIDRSTRYDANETVHFARSLEYVKARTYDISYGKLKSLQFMPLDTSAPEGTESITYEQWDEAGMAKIIANYADDLPMVDVVAKQFTSGVVSLGAGYTWTITDVRRAAMARSDFMLRKGRAARNAIDRRIDRIGATGAAEVGTTGMINNANVPLFNYPHAGAWSGLTTDQVLNNLHGHAQAVVDGTLENEEPDTMLLAPAEYGFISTKAVSGGNGMDTILSVFLKNSPYIKNVFQWNALTGAGAGAVNRAIVYPRDERVIVYNIPILFEQLPAQPKNLAFSIPCHARVGVVEIHYPLAMAYADRD